MSVRPHADAAMASWNAYFTTGVPYEVLADLLMAIDAREAPDTAFERAEAVIGHDSDWRTPKRAEVATSTLGPRILG
ncbi:DUF317 domain-containing protein [Streptomyces sp. MBT65]|uniref:DUF317 domain-containing protein n=1 Tax=Streptomyces sp. MBT65 TaxID=1488395 RepID=UPI001F42DE15|nr:DUF317 domain-containing protein [Streptomyces sp. MBT65]